ncbi:EF-P lysine aminoacylase EpmA [Hahella sp. CR1]|uniref:EF-P lysine aminoacylase EpmA n=1 Tax=Hahella sp. CR1 TaxID=2992807 RepID=UPI00244142E1|nr:EF-P lysine aminoacylase EpmA [Hahella sp. CR1]MDG9671132.1 EF-P lysine aminoacylase EpmA [Hahella sp. CR1]
MQQPDWRPSATIDTLRKRADFIKRIRAFFDDRQVLEVDTPLLSSVTATDLNLDSFDVISADPEPRYLLTSPEHAMKRLLAAGSGPIYQITRAFRRGEFGTRHNPEFAMLEWYRPGFSLQDLQREVEELLASLGYEEKAECMSYRQAFQRFVDLDPYRAETFVLQEAAAQVSGMAASELSRDEALDVLMTHRVEPALKPLGAVFIRDYPPSQAALARVGEDAEGDAVAFRFELYINGVEIANAYDELIDPVEQRRRFEEDNLARSAAKKPVIPVDERLLAALPDMPESSGIALGVDRLFMVLEGKCRLEDVLGFPADRI